MEECEIAHQEMKATFAKDLPTITEEQMEQIREYSMSFAKDGKISKEDFVKLVEGFLVKLREALSK